MFHIRFPSWSFDDLAQFELDTLEDIFKRSDWQDRALKPALSSILAPALCAVYGKRLVFTQAAFPCLQPHDKATTLEVKTMPIYSLIGHFRVASSLCFKARLSVKPVIWKWLFTSGPMQMKYIFTRKALQPVFKVRVLELLVCTWRHRGHVGGQKQKYFSPLATKFYFHVNSSRKNSVVLTPNKAALSPGCKPRIACFSSHWRERFLVLFSRTGRCDVSSKAEAVS